MHRGSMLETLDRSVVPIDARLDDAIHRLQEICAMRLDMKADEIRAQQTVH